MIDLVCSVDSALLDMPVAPNWHRHMVGARVLRVRFLLQAPPTFQDFIPSEVEVRQAGSRHPFWLGSEAVQHLDVEGVHGISVVCPLPEPVGIVDVGGPMVGASKLVGHVPPPWRGVLFNLAFSTSINVPGKKP